MSKSNTFETDLLKLLFNATALTNIARDSATPDTLYVSLHTANPDEAGTQATSETAYTGYARVNVVRTAGAWSVASGSVSPVANIDFGECTASPGAAITYFGIGTNATAGQAGYLMYSGTVSPSIVMAVGVIPRLKTTSSISED